MSFFATVSDDSTSFIWIPPPATSCIEIGNYCLKHKASYRHSTQQDEDLTPCLYIYIYIYSVCVCVCVILFILKVTWMRAKLLLSIKKSSIDCLKKKKRPKTKE